MVAGVLGALQRNRVVRDLDRCASALRQTGLPMEAAGTLQYDGAQTLLEPGQDMARHAAAREHGVPLAFIVEVHDGRDLAQRVKVHTTAVEELTRLLATPP